MIEDRQRATATSLAAAILLDHSTFDLRVFLMLGRLRSIAPT